MDESDLIRKAQGNDEVAFAKLLESHEHYLRGVAFKILKDEDDVNDALQSVRIKVWSKIGNFEGRSKFSTWLHTIMETTCLDILRAQGKGLPEDFGGEAIDRDDEHQDLFLSDEVRHIGGHAVALVQDDEPLPNRGEVAEDSVPHKGEDPLPQTRNPWTPKLSKREKDRIADALLPRFRRVARGLGFQVIEKIQAENKYDDFPKTLYFKGGDSEGELPATENFTLRIKLNPSIDIAVFKAQMKKAGFPYWFMDSFEEQYIGFRSGVSKGKNRIIKRWSEWIYDLAGLPTNMETPPVADEPDWMRSDGPRSLTGAEIWGYLTSIPSRPEAAPPQGPRRRIVPKLSTSNRLKRLWEAKRKKAGRSIDDLQLSIDAATDITAILFVKAGIKKAEEEKRALEMLRKMISRTPTK